MKFLQLLIGMLAATALGGCVFAPGQHMTRSSELSNAEARQYFNVIPITPKLIAMDAATATHAPIVPPALLDYRPGPYRIGAGDTLYITVWDHPELTVPGGAQQTPTINGRQVRSDGTLYFPFVGDAHVAGMTMEDLRRLITQRLAPYIPNPQVDVGVVTYASQRVSFAGAFGDTAPQPITSVPLTLAQALGTAKVDASTANLADLTLTRGGHVYHIDLDALQHSPELADEIYLKAGDKLYLAPSDRKEIYVMGEVLAPQAIPYKTSAMTLTKALGIVGGLNQTTANGKAVFVIRGVKDLETKPATVYELDAKSPAAFALADQFKVLPGDVVFVGASGITRWNRFLSQLLPITTAINTAATVQATTR